MADLIQNWSDPFHYDYMWRAIWVSAMIGVVCGFLSAFITLKGWSLMGDALSHAVVPGVALAYVMGLPFLRRRKSTFIDGAGDDAGDLAGHLAQYLDRRMAA